MNATMDSTSSENSTNPVDKKTLQQLAKGIMEIYEPPLVTVNTHLKELTERQEAVQSMLSSERARLDDLQTDINLNALLANLATDKERLSSISNSMMSLHRKMQSLQARAANIEKAAKLKAASQKPSTSS